MADAKTSELTAIASTDIATEDLFYYVDMSEAASVRSKKITIAELDKRYGHILVAVSKSANYTVVPADDLILCTTSGGAFTLTLPPVATSEDALVTIKKVSSATDFNSVTIDGNASETIDGDASIKLFGAGESITLQCDGSSWNIVAWTDSKSMSHTMVYPSATNIATNTSYVYFSRGFMYMDCLVSFNGSAGASGFTADIPVGPVIDTARLSGGTNSTNTLFTQLTSTAKVFDTASWKEVFAIYNTTTNMLFREAAGALLQSTITSGESVQFITKIPVV